MEHYTIYKYVYEVFGAMETSNIFHTVTQPQKKPSFCSEKKEGNRQTLRQNKMGCSREINHSLESNKSGEYCVLLWGERNIINNKDGCGPCGIILITAASLNINTVSFRGIIRSSVVTELERQPLRGFHFLQIGDINRVYLKNNKSKQT